MHGGGCGHGMFGFGFMPFGFFRIAPIFSNPLILDKSFDSLPQGEAEAVQNRAIEDSFFDNFADIAHDKYCKWSEKFTYPSMMNLFDLNDVNRVPILKSSITLESGILGLAKEALNGSINATVKEGTIACKLEKALFTVSLNGSQCGTIDYNTNTVLAGEAKFKLDRHDLGTEDLDLTKSIDLMSGDDTLCTINMEEDPKRVYTNISTGISAEAKAVLAILYIFEEALSVSYKFKVYSDASQEALTK